MLLTITCNPSVDYLYQVDNLALDDVNRVPTAVKMLGGKGINAARVANQLFAGAPHHEGQPPAVAAVIAGGENGNYLKRTLKQEGIPSLLTESPVETRNVITIMHDQQQQTELLEHGGMQSTSVLQALKQAVFNWLRTHSDTYAVSINGSLVSEHPAFYRELLSGLAQDYPTIKRVVDTSGTSLSSLFVNTPAGLSYRPQFIKPNEQELAALLGVPATTNVHELGAMLNSNRFTDVNVLVSLGAQGAVAKIAGRLYQVTIPKIAVVSPEGSGDATVGGLLSALNQPSPLSESGVDRLLRTAMAAGMANAMETRTGFIDYTRYQALYSQIKINPFNI